MAHLHHAFLRLQVAHVPRSAIVLALAIGPTVFGKRVTLVLHAVLLHHVATAPEAIARLAHHAGVGAIIDATLGAFWCDRAAFTLAIALTIGLALGGGAERTGSVFEVVLGGGTGTVVHAVFLRQTTEAGRFAGLVAAHPLRAEPAAALLVPRTGVARSLQQRALPSLAEEPGCTPLVARTRRGADAVDAQVAVGAILRLPEGNTLPAPVAGLADKLRPHAGSARTAGVALRSVLSALALTIAETVGSTLGGALGASPPRVGAGGARSALSVVTAAFLGGLAGNTGGVTGSVAAEAIHAEVGLALSVAGTRSTIGSAIATFAVDALGGRLAIVVGGTGRGTGRAEAEIRRTRGGAVVLAVARTVAGAGVGLEQGRSAGGWSTLDAHLGVARTRPVAEAIVFAQRVLISTKRSLAFIVRINLVLDKVAYAVFALAFLDSGASLARTRTSGIATDTVHAESGSALSR